MAIQDINAYAHLSDEDIRDIGARLAAIENEHRDALGAGDADYIKSLIRAQRTLDLIARIATASSSTVTVPAGMMLAIAKILENLEIGHNVMHGQWDWMNDPEIHSSTWEWDNTGPSSGWKHSHNVVHHTYTNIIGMDNDIGYGVLRVTRDRTWTPMAIFQPLINIVLASLFEVAVGFYDVDLGRYFTGRQTWEETKPRLMDTVKKVGRQVGKDYVLFPAVAAVVGYLLPGRGANRTSRAGRALEAKKRAKAAVKTAVIGNIARNVWAYAVIFCGHFPDDVETFTKRTLEEETRDEWYLRQMLGSANFRGGTVLSIMSGNLNHQIEHHLFPDMPSNHLSAISTEVEKIAAEYGLPYNTDSFPKQLMQVQRTLLKLSLPNNMLRADASNAPEVRSDAAFTTNPEIAEATGPRQLRKGLALLKKARPRFLA
ncbi:fatty acid desaturase family protein [Candidatus Corynebacterium faecigallinarum]|uniref:fatty acid desaturase family protein n=1 Tax=Candidatus Corynebacterium faecigallinarum TaxID=2838528 RepID=UPI003FD35BC6